MSKIIRMTNMVPEVYVNQSRDFQLLCRLIDTAFNAAYTNIEKLRFSNDYENCSSSWLKQLASKIGFEYTSYITDDELRKILSCFKYLVSYKGSLRGIQGAIQLFMNIKHIYFRYDINVTSRTQGEINAPNDTIEIIIYNMRVDNLDILSDILKYILPCGYNFSYIFAVEIKDDQAQPIDYAQKVDIGILNVVNNTLYQITSPDENGDLQVVESATRGTSISGDEDESLGLVNAFNTMEVPSDEQITNSKVSGSNDHTAILIMKEDNQQ